MSNSEQCVPGTPPSATPMMPAYIHVNSLFLCNACFFCSSELSTFFESSAAACSSPLTLSEREELRLQGGRVICLPAPPQSELGRALELRAFTWYAKQPLQICLPRS